MFVYACVSVCECCRRRYVRPLKAAWEISGRKDGDDLTGGGLCFVWKTVHNLITRCL